MSNEDNAKGGVLEGGALTDEVIASSATVLRTRGFAGMSGLQQFYSPPEMASLAAKLVGQLTALDLTAGDGSLLQFIPEEQRSGIEIDADQIANAKTDGNSYRAVHGDVQQVAPILVDMGAKWPALVCNPPYGLKWTDPTINEGRETNSVLVTFHYAARLLSQDGTLIMLAGGDGKFANLQDELTAHDPTHRRDLVPYVVLHVDDMFDNVTTPTDVIIFGWKTRYHGMTEPDLPHVQHISCSRAELDSPDTLTTLKRLRTDKTLFRHWTTIDSNRVDLWMKAAQSEHDRRNGQRLVRKNEFDIYGEKKKIRVHLRAFTALSLARGSHRIIDELNGLDRQPLEYFVLNKKAWEKLQEMQEQETLFIEPALIDRVAKLQRDRERDIVPMYELKPQQRLAYLEDLEKVLCTKSHVRNERSFTEGVEYPISVQSVISQSRERGRPVVNKKTGDVSLRDFLTERKLLQIRIQGCMYSEVKDDIEHIIEHFAIPDPGTVADRYPEETEANREMLTRFEDGKSWKYKPFQKEDMARLLVKGSGLLAWEQGLGKTLAGLTFAKGCIEQHAAQEQVLFVVPQDLIKQWRKEAKRFFGIDLKWLRNRGDFLEARKHLRAGGTGWYITHFEALSRIGKIEEMTPLGTVRAGVRIDEQKMGGDWYYDDNEELHRHPVTTEKVRTTLTDETHCPNCMTSYRVGYNPNHGCGRCGWSRYERRVKPLSDVIKSCFRHGVMVIDELTKMKGESDRSRAVRGIKAKHVLGMTGTPIKNYIPDSFWGLWKSLGDASPRFPYAYHGGKTKYENDFAVVEYQMSGWKKENRKVLPEVTNVSRLWRLLSSSIIRKRKEETGEKLVPRTFYPTHVPLGVRQRAAAERWLHSFADYFALNNPLHPVVSANMHETMAAMLGQLWKLEFAATLPQADPARDFWVENVGEYKALCEQIAEMDDGPKVRYREENHIEPVSDWTPANCRVMELAMHHAAAGDRVLIGSDIVLPGKFLCEQLASRGVKVGNVLTEGDGPPKTKSPAARAKIVEDFQSGKVDVLIATCEALNLGHNLDAGSVVIINGLPWDYATFDQFIARIHRLTSKKDVKVYVIIPRGTLTERKWKLLVDKGAAAMLALDGRLIEQDEEPIDQATILKQLVADGIPVNGTEVEEDELERRWLEIKGVDDLGEIILEGAGIEDLHEMTEEEEADVEERTLPDPDDPAEVEAEPEEEPELEARCPWCGTMFDISDATWSASHMIPYCTITCKQLDEGSFDDNGFTEACAIKWRESTDQPCWDCGFPKSEHGQVEDAAEAEPEVAADTSDPGLSEEPELHPALVQHPDLREDYDPETERGLSPEDEKTLDKLIEDAQTPDPAPTGGFGLF